MNVSRLYVFVKLIGLLLYSLVSAYLTAWVVRVFSSPAWLFLFPAMVFSGGVFLWSYMEWALGISRKLGYLLAVVFAQYKIPVNWWSYLEASGSEPLLLLFKKPGKSALIVRVVTARPTKLVRDFDAPYGDSSKDFIVKDKEFYHLPFWLNWVLNKFPTF